MAFAHFESAQPSGGALFSSGTVRNNFNSLYQGDLSPLRARAQDTPDLTVQVGGGLVENYYQQVWFNNNGTPSNYAGGNSATIATPSANPRIALLTLDRAGSLTWTYGSEAASPSAPDCPINEIPIAYVYERVGMTQIVNYEDRASYPSGGYLYRDIRPFMTPASYLHLQRTCLSVSKEEAVEYSHYGDKDYTTVITHRIYIPTNSKLLFSARIKIQNVLSTTNARVKIGSSGYGVVNTTSASYEWKDASEASVSESGWNDLEIQIQTTNNIAVLAYLQGYTVHIY